MNLALMELRRLVLESDPQLRMEKLEAWERRWVAEVHELLDIDSWTFSAIGEPGKSRHVDNARRRLGAEAARACATESEWKPVVDRGWVTKTVSMMLLRSEPKP